MLPFRVILISGVLPCKLGIKIPHPAEHFHVEPLSSSKILQILSDDDPKLPDC